MCLPSVTEVKETEQAVACGRNRRALGIVKMPQSCLCLGYYQACRNPSLTSASPDLELPTHTTKGVLISNRTTGPLPASQNVGRTRSFPDGRAAAVGVQNVTSFPAYQLREASLPVYEIAVDSLPAINQRPAQHQAWHPHPAKRQWTCWGLNFSQLSFGPTKRMVIQSSMKMLRASDPGMSI
ncbi:hypothetical protein VTK56DRAFT_4066 [Thermocarpiscus australiensis]